MDEIHAAMLAERMKWLPEFTIRRHQIADAYQRRISNPLICKLALPEEKSAHVYHLFVVTCEQREALQAYLLKHQVQALIHYPIPIHHQEPCRNIARDPQGLAQSEIHALNCLSLPCHPQMTDSDIDIVISAINLFHGK